MNGILTAHRILDGKEQTVTGSISNVVIAKIRNSLLNFMNNYLQYVKPATVTETVYFTEDSELVTPSHKTDHVENDPVRVYFHVTVEDDINEFAENYLLYADVAVSGAADPPAYTEMNTAFKDAQYQKSGITKHELSDAGVFVDMMNFVM